MVSSKGCVLYFNPRFSELTDLTPESVGDDPIVTNLHPEDQHFALQCRERLRGGESPVRFTARHLKADGSYFAAEIRAFNIDWQGAPAQLLMIHDISQRKELEAQLRNNISEQEAVLNSTLVGVMMTASFQVRWINRRASDILTYSKYELVDFPISILFPSHALWQEFELESAGLLAVGQSVTIECELKRKGGDNIFCLLHGQPIKSRTREKVVVWTVLDVSERKRAERETQAAVNRERDLAEIQSRFVAMASHEFRTPLTAILSSTELLEHHRSMLTYEDQGEALLDIRTSVLRMRSLIEGIFTVGRADAGALVCRPMAVDIQKLIQTVTYEAKLQHPGQHEIRIESGVFELDGNVLIDPELARIILVNLIGNSIKYSPTATPIIISTHIVTGAGDKLTIVVQDFGIGIPIADQSRITQTYFRASNVTGIKGIGLGLTIVRRAVDAHHGSMLVESTPGSGTRVEIVLPLVSGT